MSHLTEEFYSDQMRITAETLLPLAGGGESEYAAGSSGQGRWQAGLETAGRAQGGSAVGLCPGWPGPGRQDRRRAMPFKTLQCGGLRALLRHGAGLDMMSMAGVVVANAPGANAATVGNGTSVAQHPPSI